MAQNNFPNVEKECLYLFEWKWQIDSSWKTKQRKLNGT